MQKETNRMIFILEITAANRANICSYTVSYEALSQPVGKINFYN